MTLRRAGACLLLAALSVACDEPMSAGDDAAAEAVTAVVRDVVAGLPPGEDPDARPVVYIVGIGEEGIAAAVQADVAEALVDDVEVRFADERAEAVDSDEPGEPVQDGGVLVALGDIPESSGPIDVTVEVYRNADDRLRVVYAFDPGTAEVRVTATSLLPRR